jgi:hypothetical protein
MGPSQESRRDDADRPFLTLTRRRRRIAALPELNHELLPLSLVPLSVVGIQRGADE